MACAGCGECVQTGCDRGFYGNACNLTCSSHCRQVLCTTCTCATCNSTSGHCLNGCSDGWYGSLCQRKCPENCSWKRNASGSCGRFSGACVYGCEDGFYGATCNKTCGARCGNTRCNQTTGACLPGCIHGFTGSRCQVPVGGAEDDHVAGAVGGAFVIILWGVIVVILICFIRRKRQKEYQAFTRNRSLNSGRGSSRRRLHQQTSVSSGSLGPPLNDGDQFYEIAIPELESYPRSCDERRLFYVRSYSDESPVLHLCARHEELRNSFRKKSLSVGNKKQLEHADDIGRPRDLIRPMTSDEDLEDINEITEMWTVRQHKDTDNKT